MTKTPALQRYTKACSTASSVVISTYSTSFGASVKLLGARHRGHIRNVYALVRMADELVDGVGAEAGLTPEQQRVHLDALEAETAQAITFGFSTNPVVHAFAVTAVQCGIDDELIAPFFRSMRTDIPDHTAATNLGVPQLRSFDTKAHANYVYGSAEVIGLMCMRIFTRGRTYTADQRDQLQAGARALGAAFQNINFLRDLADDSVRLGRDYLGAHDRLTETERAAWLKIIGAQLEAARKTLPLLPKDARRAVRCATDFFGALTNKISRIPASQLYESRVRIPNPRKALLLAQATTRTALERS